MPWNFPLLMASWKLGPALATGNSVVLKPSEKSPLTALRVAELAMEAGLPEGVLNVVPGFGATAGESLALHMDVDCVAFTGSTRTGKRMLEYAGKSNMKRVWLECGGKAPNVVLGDVADLERAATAAAFGIFFNQGEMCSAASRLVVHESVKDAMLEKIVEIGKSMAPGDPLDPKTRLGAIVDQVQLNTVMGYIESGKEEGADVRARRQRARQGQRRLLRRADGVRRREARHEDRARGDLRAGAVDDHVQATSRRRSRSRTTSATGSRPRSGAATSRPRTASRNACAPARST